MCVRLERLSLEDPAAYGDNKAIMGMLKDMDSVKPHMKKAMGSVQFTKVRGVCLFSRILVTRSSRLGFLFDAFCVWRQLGGLGLYWFAVCATKRACLYVVLMLFCSPRCF